MTLKTYAQLKTIIERELDLEQEVFVQTAEMLEYFNQAVNEAEANIHKLGLEDDYFLTSANLSLTSGSASVTLPSNIYAAKIRAVIYKNGGTIYEIKRMRNSKRFLSKTLIDYENSSNPEYVYLLKNDSNTAGIKMHLSPTAKETSTTNVTCWYIRNATALSADADECDIPEFYSFILAFVKYRILDKEGHPNADNAKIDLEAQRKLMIETLENMVPDEESELEQDQSHYEEMS